eukprot:s459_g10.t1
MFDVVEVRWPSEPFIWRRARIWDVHNEGVTCFFDDGSVNEIVFANEDVRFLSEEEVDPNFHPETGDLVEYELLPTQLSSGGWAVAKVFGHSDCLWHLHTPERSERSELAGEVLMPLSRLRPSVTRNIEGLQREEAFVQSNLLSEDVSTCFRRIESLAVGLQDGRESPELLRIRQVGLEPKVLAVGTFKAVQRAKLLIPSMLHHQRKAKALEDACQKREEALAMRSMKKIREGWDRTEATIPQGLVKDEFFLDVANVGRFVGKGGSNIRSLQSQFNVSIFIFDEDDTRKRVLVLGPNQEAVAGLRKASEIKSRVLATDKETRKWLLWRSKVVDTIKKMCGLISIQVEEHQVVVTGTPAACENGLKFLQAQIQYFQTLQQLETTKVELMKQLGEGPELVWPLQFERTERRGPSRPTTPRAPRTQKVWIYVPNLGLQSADTCVYLSPNLEGYGELLGKSDLQPWYPKLRDFFVGRLGVSTTLSVAGCVEALRSLQGSSSEKLLKLAAGSSGAG